MRSGRSAPNAIKRIDAGELRRNLRRIIEDEARRMNRTAADAAWMSDAEYEAMIDPTDLEAKMGCDALLRAIRRLAFNVEIRLSRSDRMIGSIGVARPVPYKSLLDHAF